MITERIYIGKSSVKSQLVISNVIHEHNLAHYIKLNRGFIEFLHIPMISQ